MATNPRVLLTLPAQPEFLRVARVAASGLASRIGFSLDEVDDLRLALDELCYGLIGKGNADSDLQLCYRMESDSLTIEGHVPSPSTDGLLSLGEFSQQILTALVDEHRIWNDGNFRYFSLTKRQSARPE